MARRSLVFGDTLSPYTKVFAAGGPQLTVTSTKIEGAAYDSDAQAYFTRAGITDADQKTAWNDFVLTGKADGWWDDLVVVYPALGGNATSHSKNAKSDAYHVTWSGTVTHDSDGFASDGSTGYGNTGWHPNLLADKTSVTLACYLQGTSGNTFAFGAHAGGLGYGLGLAAFFGELYVCNNDESDSFLTVAGQSLLGSTIGTRTTNALATAYRGGVSVGTKAGAVATTGTANNLYLCCRNDAGTPLYFSSTAISFVAIGNGIDGTNAASLHAAIVALQTALGRNV